ncbi:MAG: PilN domain-containing protein [Methylococcaceae bacterium]
MIQQINLYQDSLKQGQTKPGVNNMLVGLIIIFVLIVSYSIYLFLDLNDTKKSLVLAKQQLTEAETQVRLIQVKYPRQQINQLLTQEISRSLNMLTSLSRVIQVLTDKNSDQTQGFSRYFTALARQSIADIWLRGIVINGQTHSLIIQGSTYNPEKIAVFLQKLHHESVFRGRIFARLIMAEEENTENQINFTVSTTAKILEQTANE